MRSAVVIVALLIATAPAMAATKLRLIEVDSQLVDCVGVAPMKCLQVREGPERPWEVFHGLIEGFTFEPGYRYRLRVEEVPAANTPADAPS